MTDIFGSEEGPILNTKFIRIPIGESVTFTIAKLRKVMNQPKFQPGWKDKDSGAPRKLGYHVEIDTDQGKVYTVNTFAVHKPLHAAYKKYDGKLEGKVMTIGYPEKGKYEVSFGVPKDDEVPF